MTPRAALLAVLAATAALALPGAAQARPLLDDADAAELAQTLADATDEQGVCYGWHIEVQDDGGSSDGVDEGSNLGPELPVPITGSCARYVELRGRVHWTSDWSESDDSSSARVVSNFPEAPTIDDLQDLGLDGGGDLKDDDGDAKLSALVAALPAVTADKLNLPYVPFEDTTIPAAQQGQPTGSSLPDWLRDRWFVLVLALLLLGAGGWLLVQRRAMAFAEERDSKRPKTETDT